MQSIKNIAFTLLCCGVISNVLLAPVVDLDSAEYAGNIGLVLNTTSVQHVLTTAVPLAAYFALNNKTFPLNIVESHIAYKLEVKSIHINTVSLGTPVFEQVNGTSKLHVRLTNVDIDTNIDGGFYVLHFIPFHAQQIVIKDAVIDLVLESTSDDNIHWALHDETKMQVGSINVTLSNKFLTKVLKLFTKSINNLVNKLMPQFCKLIDQQITALNQMVAQESEFTWDLNMLGKNYPLNMTQTTAPSLVKDSRLIKLNFDGRFHPAQAMSGYYSHPYFPDISKTHREQLWVHENTFNSLIMSASSDYFPMQADFDGLDDAVLEELPELQKVCKDKCNISLTLDIKKNDYPKMKITQEKGITVGDSGNALVIDVMVSNATHQTPSSVLTLETYYKMQANFTMANVVFYPVFQGMSFCYTNLTKQSILMGSHDYVKVLYNVTKIAGQNWNKKYEAGIPIGAFNPQLAMIGGLIKNSTISPYVSDGWLYAGFSMAADAPYYHKLYEEPTPIVEVEQKQFLQ